MSRIVKLSRNSRNIGYGYTTACTNDLFGNLVVEPVTSPIHVGTVKQVMGLLATDKTFNSLSGSGTCYKTAWFVKVGGEWRKVLRGVYDPANLLDTFPVQTPWGTWENRYSHDWLEFEVE